jgi:hypothetical protein
MAYTLDDIYNYLVNTVNVSQKTSQTSLTNISNALTSGFKGILDAITSQGTALSSDYTSINNALTSGFKGISDAITSQGTALSSDYTSINNALTSGFKGISDAITSQGTELNDINSKINPMVTSFENAISTKDSVLNMAGAMGSFPIGTLVMYIDYTHNPLMDKNGVYEVLSATYMRDIDYNNSLTYRLLYTLKDVESSKIHVAFSEMLETQKNHLGQ